MGKYHRGGSNPIRNAPGKGGSFAAGCLHLLQQAIQAELPRSVDHLIRELNNLSAASADVMQLMEVLPALVSVSRYGNVRKTDAALVAGIIDSMITRMCQSSCCLHQVLMKKLHKTW